MITLPVALGLYSVRAHIFTDLEGTLKKVQDMGYDGVEFYGPFSIPPQKIRDTLCKHQLLLCGWHVGLELLQGVNLPATIAYLKAVGAPLAAVPYLGGNNAADWEKHAKELTNAAQILAGEGIGLGYHNHAHEFNQTFDGKTPWEILFDHAGELLFPQVDTGNALQGGGDPLHEISRFSSRLASIHYKPFKNGEADNGMDAMFGQDDNQLTQMVLAAQNGSAKYHIIEYECEHTYSQMGGARRALETFKAVCR